MPDCDTDNFANMKIGDVSLIAYIIGNPVKVVNMIPDEYVWLTQKGIPRLQKFARDQMAKFGLAFEF